MIKGTTKTGFKFSISDDVKDDQEFIEALADLNDGDALAAIKVQKILLGEDQYSKLREHCRSKKTGRISAARMQDECLEIMKYNPETKNS